MQASESSLTIASEKISPKEPLQHLCLREDGLKISQAHVFLIVYASIFFALLIADVHRLTDGSGKL